MQNENIDWYAVYEKLSSIDICHEGTPHEGSIPHSGRYPYGSGLEPYKKAKDFNARVNQMRKEGKTEAEIAEAFGMSINHVRAKVSYNDEMWRAKSHELMWKMHEAGYSNTQIGKELGINPTSVGSAIKAWERGEKTPVMNTVKAFETVLKDGYVVDCGKGVAAHLGVSEEAVIKATRYLELQGYQLYTDIGIPQVTNEHQVTPTRLVAPKGMSTSDILSDMTQIKLPIEYSEDGGKTLTKRQVPVEVARDRIYVRYAEDGGKDRDGTIELRRGVKDIDMGLANYAQVRIAVEGGMYMKGMAVYGDVPDGYDIVYNSNKKKGTPDLKVNEVGKVVGGVFKECDKKDIYNPFGASIKDEDQLKLIRTKTYVDEKGNKKQSALNIVSEEGDWGEWSNTLASQFLSKQSTKLAKEQLDKAYKEHLSEYNDISKIANPYVKEKLLRSFADECDSDAVHLKAAALPGQRTHVLLPEPTLKENEIFAPKYKQGEEVVLVRYPHGGIFEIPRLVVNNNNKEAQKKVGLDSKDAVAIHPKAAAQLSGADFDGDTALVIPVRGKDIKNMDYLPGLKDFDPDIYNLRSTGKKYNSLTKKNKGMQMGIVTNLINDMTIQNASWDEIERATKYSMVVIDSPKHDLDYRQAEKDYDIDGLRRKYQAHPFDPSKKGYGGVSTLISAAKSPEFVKARKYNYRIDPETGEKIFYNTTKDGKTYTVHLGEEPGTYDRKIKSTKMYETNDAHALSSGTRMEEIYADYANSLKDLGNKGRLESTKVKDIPYSKAASHVYAKEVASLENKLKQAELNAPLERQANLIAKKIVDTKMEYNPDMDKDDIKKARNVAIKEARTCLGAKHFDFTITDEEWDALNSGAIKKTTQQEIFKRCSDEELKKATIPRTRKTMTDNQVALVKSLSAAGYSLAEISDRIGFSVTAVADAIK